MSGDVQQFQVDLRGVVDLLSRHIYSSPRVYLRELLQNARDAIAARREVDGGGSRIRITPLTAQTGEFVLRDDGVGLTAAEVADLLATVGRSSKRDIFDLPRSDFLGQFGIGLLSCFMVADTIVIRSRSARGGSAVEWTGSADGTFRVVEIDDDLPTGTSVHLVPRFDADELLRPAAVHELATTFGEFLPVQVTIDAPGGDIDVTREAPFLDPAADVEAAVQYGRDLLGAAPLDVIPLTEPATGTQGLAYVLPFAPPPGARQATRMYLGRMLLSERIDDVLPDWAFFVRAVIDSTGLAPTASRESLVEDTALEHVREQLGAGIRRWVLELGLREPHRLAQFVAVHEVGLKSLVRHDEELARFITRWLTVETTHGTLRIGELVERYPHVRYAQTVDEFRQVAGISPSDEVLVNGGYLYDADLIRLLPDLYPQVTVEKVDVTGELDRLDPPPLDDRDIAMALESRAGAVLQSSDCAVVVRAIDRPELTGLYVADPEVLRTIDRGRTKGIASTLWGGVLDRIDQTLSSSRDDDLTARLCLNWSNRVVRALVRVEDDAVFARTVQLLYIQALLAGHHPLSDADRALMTSALSDLVSLSAGIEGDTLPFDAR
ncbi:MULTISPECIES: HSP90 family protein [unclassified Microbacterium]|uniref:HSP90 family protein n=1 Tax=unclassified Microbacterium TaxID=2609290 RepID=UPI0021A3DA61|nr:MULTISPECIES: HSP90 family protein [unclassified Microbacterium]MCT1363001.1 HSP90 family protein [Microbacterium sp. p3-SID131]MCT1378094.1 HSP90 family protein [Microbacterium sp. p3-SID337]